MKSGYPIIIKWVPPGRPGRLANGTHREVKKQMMTKNHKKGSILFADPPAKVWNDRFGNALFCDTECPYFQTSEETDGASCQLLHYELDYYDWFLAACLDTGEETTDTEAA